MNLKKIQNVCFAIIAVCVILGTCLGAATIWGLMESSAVANKFYSTLLLIFISAFCMLRIARKLDLNDNQIIRFIQD